MSYSKICKICGNEFESESKNAKYCSDNCSKRGAKKARRSRKLKHINAVRRGDDKEIDGLIRLAYKLAHEAAKLCLHKKCACKDKDHICSEKLVIHHIDHNVLNNHPSNLMWLCEKAHREIHKQEEDCSINEEIKSFITIRKQSEIRERNLIRQKERETDLNHNA